MNQIKCPKCKKYTEIGNVKDGGNVTCSHCGLNIVRLTAKAKSIVFAIFAVIFLYFIFSGDDNSNDTSDPLSLGQKTVNSLVGKKIPYSKWDKWGGPETLEGTNNKRWIAYLDKANISFISNKKTDIIKFAGFGKESAAEHLKNNPSREDKIKLQFSPWDGSHRNFEALIKKSMHDPSSYEHDSTVYYDKGKYLIVQTAYRGKNAFGAMVRGSVKAKVSLDGYVMKILK